jgi:phage N-6-adenine-methyltransferase
MVSQALFSSAKADWTTPTHLFEQLDSEFHFDLDAAATFENKKCLAYLGPDHHCADRQDALQVRTWADFGASIWCNPPYPVKKEWIYKAEETAQEKDGAQVVMLVPARTDTQWWTEATQTADEIRFLVGRLKFGEVENSAPFPSALLIWGRPPGCVSRTRPIVGWWDYR